MVDALVSGASVERRAGSSPVLGTIRSKVDTTVSALIFFYPPPPGLFRSVKSKSKCNTTKMPD